MGAGAWYDDVHSLPKPRVELAGRSGFGRTYWALIWGKLMCVKRILHFIWPTSRTADLLDGMARSESSWRTNASLGLFEPSPHEAARTLRWNLCQTTVCNYYIIIEVLIACHRYCYDRSASEKGDDLLCRYRRLCPLTTLVLVWMLEESEAFRSGIF